MNDRTPLADRPLAVPHPHRLAPTHPAYDEILATHAAALERAFQQLVERQSALRTAVERRPQGAVQRIHAKVDFHLPYDDLSRLAPDHAKVIETT